MHRPIGLQPQFVDLLGRQLALFAARLVQRLLEARQHHLAEDRGEAVLDLAAQQRQADPRLRVKFQQPLEGQHLAEDAGHLRGGQRRVALQVADRRDRY